MKILIVGEDINSLLLAKYLKVQNPEHDIYLTTSDDSASDVCTSINIRENNIPAIVDFVKYNAIEFTISFSKIAIINGIADVFKQEGFPIFAPCSEPAKITYFNSLAKKIMYKLKINTPKFGIFDRENVAIDYAKNAKYPIVIENDFFLNKHESYKCDTFSKAKLTIQKMFENDNEKIVIKNYLDIPPLYMYFITDGFNVLPLATVKRQGDENYTSIICPETTVSENLVLKVLQRAIYPFIDDISQLSKPYVGILGVKLKVYRDSFVVLDFYNGFENKDFQTFLSVLDDDLLSLFYTASQGVLCDVHHYVYLKDEYSYTLSIHKNCIERDKYIEEDFFECETSESYVCTSSALTLNGAKRKLLDYVSCFVSEDVFKKIEEQELVEECVR